MQARRWFEYLARSPETSNEIAWWRLPQVPTSSAALGAYLVGVISGVYDLTIAAGLAAGFSWRPLTLRHPGIGYALVVGVVAALGPAAARLVEYQGIVDLEPSLTEGFAAGFADGMVRGRDQDVNGAIATTVVATLSTALAMRYTPPLCRRRGSYSRTAGRSAAGQPE